MLEKENVPRKSVSKQKFSAKQKNGKNETVIAHITGSSSKCSECSSADQS
jgi:hypothetical protein